MLKNLEEPILSMYASSLGESTLKSAHLKKT